MILTPALRNSRLSLFLIIGILTAHFLLAAGFMLYFFHVPSGVLGGGAGQSPPLASALADTANADAIHLPGAQAAALNAPQQAHRAPPNLPSVAKDNSIQTLKPTS